MQPLLEINHIYKSYINDINVLHDVSFTIGAGECFGLVGESGSGKSTLARITLALERPDAGEVTLNGINLHRLKGKALRAARRHIQVVFQDPTASLNPRLPVWKTVIEPLDNYPDAVAAFLTEVRHNRRDLAAALLHQVGLDRELLDRFPHQLSGGQRQRVAIARAISLQPQLLVCDEPTSSLDVSIQAQILNLFKELKESIGLSYLFISHDLAAVRFLCDRVGVLRHGRVVDVFPSRELLSRDRHAYTRAMAKAVQL
ncbi:ABC transporter ATP-binding protein [Paenibacillus xerothermodurans]|uniref:ABC transporter ATP-binding protein n=2 Tax=Paenibacillus xerothermodurans TaxID=1977292 RepID=A0A2W1P0X5_PAEXE|nr:ABC transporter ATP-binding protein [Paenibacillus xerothermodurans]